MQYITSRPSTEFHMLMHFREAAERPVNYPQSQTTERFIENHQESPQDKRA